MNVFLKFLAKIGINGAILYFAPIYFSGFVLNPQISTLIVGAGVLAALNVFVRPILRLISTPLLWITFGLFNVVLHVAILWIADQLLTQLTITNFSTLFWVSIIIGFANSIF